MARHFNVTGLLTQELIAPGENVSVSNISITNVGLQGSSIVDMYMEKKLTGKFYFLRKVIIPVGVTLTHELFGFNNRANEFGLYVKLYQDVTKTLTGSIDPTASTVVVGVGTAFLSEVSIGDGLTVSGETRTVVGIAGDAKLKVDTAFSNNANDSSPDVLVRSPIDIILS